MLLWNFMAEGRAVKPWSYIFLSNFEIQPRAANRMFQQNWAACKILKPSSGGSAKQFFELFVQQTHFSSTKVIHKSWMVGCAWTHKSHVWGHMTNFAIIPTFISIEPGLWRTAVKIFMWTCSDLFFVHSEQLFHKFAFMSFALFEARSLSLGWSHNPCQDHTHEKHVNCRSPQAYSDKIGNSSFSSLRATTNLHLKLVSVCKTAIFQKYATELYLP